MGITLGVFLGIESEATTAVFGTLRTGRAQRDALYAAAQHILSAEMFRLFEAILGVVSVTEKVRADLAHGHWGIINDDPTVVTWVESRHHSTWNAKALNSEPNSEGHGYLLAHTYFYTMRDFDEAYEQIDFTWKLLFDFLGLYRDPSTQSSFWANLSGDALYAALASEPRVVAARKNLDRRQSRQ
jgi:hypothetical protein